MVVLVQSTEMEIDRDREVASMPDSLMPCHVLATNVQSQFHLKHHESLPLFSDEGFDSYHERIGFVPHFLCQRPWLPHDQFGHESCYG